MLYLLCSGLVKTFVRVTTRLKVSGKENVPPEGPLIVIANHTSFLDPLLIIAALGRRVMFMAKKELFQVLVLGRLIATLAFPVERGRGDLAALRQARQVLEEGKALIIFPEGSRSPDGKLRQAKAGVALLASWSKASVLPVAVVGTTGINGWRWIFRRPRVEVRIGKAYAIHPEPDTNRNQLTRYSDEMMTRVAMLMPAPLRGYYGRDDAD